MLKLALLPMLCGCVLLVDAPVSSGEQPDVDCGNATTQLAMNICAGRDFEKADAELNAQYKTTRDLLRQRDAAGTPETRGAEEALVKAQRAWVAYRDAECSSRGFQARGGSMEPLVLSACRTDLTQKRTAELKELTDQP
jgi:uncharacterized protein YecT (DUF1311 family)